MIKLKQILLQISWQLIVFFICEQQKVVGQSMACPLGPKSGRANTRPAK